MKVREHKNLLQTFNDLDIRPFTPASVEAYKEPCEKNANRRLAQAAQVGSILSMLAIFGAVPLLVFAILFGFVNAAFYAAVVVSTGTIIAIGGGIVVARYAVERKWVMHELSTYEEPIPEFVLQTAVDVKKAHPDAEFFVCTLEENRVVVDPFLVLRIHDGEEERDYYLEVWNESRFDGRREI